MHKIDKDTYDVIRNSLTRLANGKMKRMECGGN